MTDDVLRRNADLHPQRDNGTVKVRRAFTLLELLIVLALLAILAGITGGEVTFVLSLFFLAGLVLFALLSQIFWERKSGLSPRWRNILMLALYVLLVADIALGYRYGLRNWGTEAIRSDVAANRWDMRNLSVTLETYYIDNEAYPPAEGPDRNLAPFDPDGSRVSAGYIPRLLTTPVPYTGIRTFIDRFSGRKAGGRFRYATNGTSCWIITSPGPDRDDDMAIEEFPDTEKGSCDRAKFLEHLGAGTAVEYDPTNGARSSGDIVWLGP